MAQKKKTTKKSKTVAKKVKRGAPKTFVQKAKAWLSQFGSRFSR